MNQERSLFHLLPHDDYIPRRPAESLCFQIYVGRASDCAPGQASSSSFDSSLLFHPLLFVWSFFLQPGSKTQARYFDITVWKSFERLSSIPISCVLDDSHLSSTSQNHDFYFNSSCKTRRGSCSLNLITLMTYIMTDNGCWSKSIRK